MSNSQSKPTILFMARDPDDRYSLRSLLEKEGYEVFGRSTRERAAQLMSVYALDLILIDLDQHEASGIDYCAYLRSTSYARVVPIIIIGPDDEHGTRCVAAYQAGADDFVPTPFVFNVCLAKVRYHLQGRAKRQAAVSSMSVVVSAGELPGVLQFVEVEQKTGKLTVKSGPGSAVLTIEQGRLVNAYAPNVDGPETITEILCWDSSSVVFQDTKLTAEDRRFEEKITRLLMNASVQVDEYRAIQKKLPGPDVIFIPGERRPGKEETALQRSIYQKAVDGHGRDELLHDPDYTERQVTVTLLELLDQHYLAQELPPYEDYTRRCYASYKTRPNGDVLRLARDLLSHVEFPLDKPADRPAHAEADWTRPAPILAIVGNKQEHGQMLLDSFVELHRAITGKSPAERKHLGGTATVRLVFGDHHYLDLILLPPILERSTLLWLDTQVAHLYGVIVVASDQDRYNTLQNLRLIRLLRQRFRGVYYHVVPRIMDGEVAIFKMDCEKCGYKLAVDIDGVGDTGICPICNAEIVMPDCLDNLAKVMRLPRDVPVVQAQPDAPQHARDLFVLTLDTILYAVEHPEKSELRDPPKLGV